MKNITVCAPAKINLFLDVTAKRHDGYHNIVSVMHPVTLSDTVSITQENGENAIRITCDKKNIPLSEDNIAYKAAELFYQTCGIKNYRTHVHIQKSIPVAAGLAGGSTDAAAVLIALNQINHAALNEEALCTLGANIGADVPFCIVKRPMLTTGIGNQFTDIPPLPDCFLIIAKSGKGVSTKEAYNEIDRIGCAVHKDVSGIMQAMKNKDLPQIGANAYNLFEQAILPLHPQGQQLKNFFQRNGAVFSLMSGSGPAVFAIYMDRNTAEKVQTELLLQGIDAHLCKPFFKKD